MPQTLQQQYSAALIALGAREVPTGRRSYKTFTLTNVNGTRTYYVGKAGSVRHGRIHTGSIALNDKQKANLLKLGREASLADL